MSSLGWTDDRIEMLKKLWTAGLSASQVAAELGHVTRNAVIGKVHRLKLEPRGKTHNANVTPRPRRTGNSVARIRHAKAVAEGTVIAPQKRRYVGPAIPHNPPITHQHAAVRMADEVAPLLIPFLDRLSNQCAYICTGDGEPVAVCGHITMVIRGKRGPERSSFCPRHYGITHRLPERNAA
ncbi:GcrA family cell cycle regulator [Bradyrhizobium sp. 482_C4_N1_1]|uniref:GcrA family cell cycle regulator n=1 Tax=unclassified Bradyrhizobium TaxID=2631580 RepID=UPI003F8B48C8